jgi:hypothetical protein
MALASLSFARYRSKNGAMTPPRPERWSILSWSSTGSFRAAAKPTSERRETAPTFVASRMPTVRARGVVATRALTRYAKVAS